MTLHVRLTDGQPPTVYENVRLVTTYFHPDIPQTEPEIVFHHDEAGGWGQVNIPLRNVASYWIAP